MSSGDGSISLGDGTACKHNGAAFDTDPPKCGLCGATGPWSKREEAEARISRALAMLDGLRAEHGAVVGEVYDVKRIDRGEVLDVEVCPQHPKISRQFSASPCACGADEHNRKLDEVRAALRGDDATGKDMT